MKTRTNNKKKKSSKKKKQSNNSSNNNNDTALQKLCFSRWIDKIRFYPLIEEEEKESDPAQQQEEEEEEAESTTTDGATTTRTSLSLISWNVLAEAYCTRRSQKNLPPMYQSVVFDSRKRLFGILRTLTNLASSASATSASSVDVLALQEVDMTDAINQHLSKLGYEGITSPQSKDGCGSGGRIDSCQLYYLCDKWNLLQHEIVRLDDIATLTSNNYNSGDNDNNNNNLQGLQQSFLRRNYALIARLQHKATGNTIVIATAHLFWNPRYEYVKLCQAHYVLTRAKEFILSHKQNNGNKKEQEPLILCGDFNSKPDSVVYDYITNGYINAKLVAPWYRNYYYWKNKIQNNEEQKENQDEILDDDDDINDDTDERDDDGGGGASADDTPEEQQRRRRRQDDDDDNNEAQELDDDDDDDNNNNSKEQNNSDAKNHNNDPDVTFLTNQILNHNKMDISSSNHCKNDGNNNNTNADNDNDDDGILQVRYLLDFTLNRLCRWFRILGIDTALETEEEEQLRTKEGKIILFDRCRKEKRTLITTSTKLVVRKDCPAGAYLINLNNKSNGSHTMEVAMVHVLVTHGVILEPYKFLRRCVVCNGVTSVVHDDSDKKQIFVDCQAPDLISSAQDIHVYRCNNCQKGYWFNDQQPDSLANRVKHQACQLFRSCLRAGVPFHHHNDNNSNSSNSLDRSILADCGIDIQEEQKKVSQRGEEEEEEESGSSSCELSVQCLDFINWLKDEHLKCPFQLKSAYAASHNDDDALSSLSENDVVVYKKDNVYNNYNGTSSLKKAAKVSSKEILPFTNVTDDFVDTLDYIFLNSQLLKQTERLWVPTSFQQLNDNKATKTKNRIAKGHLLPSHIWPSDHLAIGTKVCFGTTEKKEETTIEKIMK